MYNIKISVVAASLTALFFTSCSDKDLEIQPGAATNEKAFFSEPTRVQQLVNSCYYFLGANEFLGRNVTTVNELWSDNAFTATAGVGTGLNYYKHTVGDIFNDGYNLSVMQGYGNISRQANFAIYGCEKYGDNIDAATKKRVIAEAKFLKAIAHFETVRLYGQPWGFTADNSHAGIGIRKEYTESSVNRTTVKAVYDYVVAQILEAMPDLLPTAGRSGTATKAIAKGYLAKIYFQQNRYQDALNMATEALNESGVVADSVQYRFSANAKSAYSGSLFLLTATRQESQGTFTGFGIFGTYEYNAASKPVPALMMNEEVAGLVGTTDSISKRWLKANSTPDGKGFILTKYPNNTQHFNLNVLHWTELKLIKAECMAELNQSASALVELNDVRTAHALFAFTAPASTANLITAIRTQRRVEMMGEGNRIQDLKRIGAASRRGLTQAPENNIKVRNAPWDCIGMVMQIPSAEHAASPDFPFNPTGACN